MPSGVPGNMMQRPGQGPYMPYGQPMRPIGASPYPGSPQGQPSPLVTPQTNPLHPNPGTLPGYHSGMNPSVHAAVPPTGMGQGRD